MAIGNVELMHKCFQKHSHWNSDKETEDEGKNSGMSMESKVGTQIRSANDLSQPNQNTIVIT